MPLTPKLPEIVTLIERRQYAQWTIEIHTTEDNGNSLYKDELPQMSLNVARADGYSTGGKGSIEV